MLNFLYQLLLTPSHARLRYWSAIVLFLLIVIIGSIPGARAEVGVWATGLVLHGCAYAGLAFLIFTGCSGTPAQRAVKAVLHIAVMGALDEFVQSFWTYRHADIHDWMIDCTAALLTSGFMWLLWTTRRVRTA
ncbi:VanZ family protein [Pseudoduganella sp. RAF53_2]|uniref:VanZ family protein n=1 Tax=unclassified Pseudoduganella TaxID=2637179 RepID=UPI003F989CD4